MTPFLLAAAMTMPASAASFSQDNAAFAFALHAKLPAQGNLFYSPYSLSAALGMAYAGARGETAAQMAKALRFRLPPAELHEAFRQANAVLNGSASAKLAVANALWTDKAFALEPAFAELCARAYGGAATPLDFRKAAEAARKTINAWVEERTARRIKDLIPPNGVSDVTRLVITNAVYFKGEWETPFEADWTKPQPFTKADGAKVQAPLMDHTSWFEYADHADLQAVSLPYKGSGLSMLVLLPKRHGGLAALERQLSPEALAAWTRGMGQQRVRVMLPKFKLETAFGASQVLAALGMKDAFDPERADFSGMSKEKGLYVGAVLHKAFVAVDERGTEAAAATAVMMAGAAAMPAPPPVFRADHPFLFLIRDRAGNILFLGRLADPR